MAYLSHIMSLLTRETKAVGATPGATPDTDSKKGLCPKHLTLKAQDQQQFYY